MKMKIRLYSHYIWGIVGFVIIVLIPIIAPIISIINNQGIMPHILVLLACINILYEVIPFKNESLKLTKFAKLETILIIIPTIIFIAYDILLLLIKAGTQNFSYNFSDYIILGYIIAPFVVYIIDIVQNIKEYMVEDDNKNNSLRIADQKTESV